MSSSLYDTFGNTTKYKVVQDTLVAYLEDATINFPLPEASSEILAELTKRENKTFDPAKLAMVSSKLQKAGFKKATAVAMTDVLMNVAEAQGADPLDYFEVNKNTLKLTVDAYKAMNNLRPAGSRVGFVNPTKNNVSKVAGLIQP
jgi:hypothetical protein